MPKNPYLFLDSYGKKDIERFFGRTKETAQLFNAVHASNLVMLYGGSGTGKTSLVMCGLANRFKDSDWLPIFIRRGSDLNVSIRRELIAASKNKDIEAYSVQELIYELYLQYYKPVYLIFDQFEELYILGKPPEQDRFHQLINDLLDAKLNCKILIVFREEYLASLSEFEKAVPNLFDNRLRVEKMTRENLKKVIRGTARWGGIEIRDEKGSGQENQQTTVDLIFEKLKDKNDGIDLTNLQVYLDRLRRADGERQGAKSDEELEALDKIYYDPELVTSVGDIKNVLSDFLDDKLVEIAEGLEQSEISFPNKDLPLEILLTMVTDEGTKKQMNLNGIFENIPNYGLDQAAAKAKYKQAVEYCLAEFKRLRLLREIVAG